MIWFFKPYALNKELAIAYNEYCEVVPDNDWICLLDGDSMFLESDYGHIIQSYINKYPECKLFIPTTNRVKRKFQCYKGVISEEPNIKTHRKISKNIRKSFDIKDLSSKKSISMPCFIFSKKTWQEVGGFKNTGRVGGVDLSFSKKVLKIGPCYRMKGLYLFHYYRMCEGIKNNKHLF